MWLKDNKVSHYYRKRRGFCIKEEDYIGILTLQPTSCREWIERYSTLYSSIKRKNEKHSKIIFPFAMQSIREGEGRERGREREIGRENEYCHNYSKFLHHFGTELWIVERS